MSVTTISVTTMLTRRHLKSWLVLCSLGVLPGCGGDTPSSVLRSSINVKGELTDRLTDVKDEPSAKKFIEVHLTFKDSGFNDRNRIFSEKWRDIVKNLEDDHRPKRVVQFKTSEKAGTDKWLADVEGTLKQGLDTEKPDLAGAREAYLSYAKDYVADSKRFKREQKRIQDIVNQKTNEMIADKKASGDKSPRVDPKDHWPNLVKINEKETFQNMLVDNGGNNEN